MRKVPATKVTLLTLNAKYVHSSLAAWCLAEAAARFSRIPHEAFVVEATINQPDGGIVSRVAKAAPDVLGVSVYIWNARKLQALLPQIKARLPRAKLVLGGPEAAYNARHWLELGADFVVQGEGERSFPALLDALAAGEAPAPIQRAEPLETPVDPYSDSYFSALGGRIAYLETSRGCPFECTFCLSGGSRPRFFPLEQAKEQMLKLSCSGAQTIKLVDRTFNCDSRRAYELFEYVISLDTRCCFHFEVAADLFDERTLALLRGAPPGRIQLEAGLQSFNQPTLDAVSRRTSLEKAERSLRALLAGRNIHVHVDLIAGLPFEGLGDFKRSFDRAYAIGAHTLQLGFLKLLHGSALRARAAELGLRYAAEPPYEIESTQWISARELDVIRQAEHGLQAVYNSGRFLKTAEYALAAAGVSPFEFYRMLGAASPGHGVPLGSYAERLYGCMSTLHGVDDGELCNNMALDWLCSMRGKNMPAFLRERGMDTRGVAAHAAHMLGRKIERCEAFAPRAGEGFFIDSTDADPVTGRYALHRALP